MADGAMESPIVTVLNIGKTLIPCTWILRVIHMRDVHNHLIDDLLADVLKNLMDLLADVLKNLMDLLADVLKNLMDLLADVLNPFNEFGGFVGLRLNVRIFCLCGCKR
jgi:hypothetical protein